MLDTTDVASASAALTLLSAAAIVVAWIFALKRTAPIQSPPLRIAQVFLRFTPPIYAIGLILSGISRALWAAGTSGPGNLRTYLSIIASFLITAAAIGITVIMYLATIGTTYVALGRMKWWKLLRLDALVGGALLLVFDIAYFGRRLSTIGEAPTGWLFFWLLLVIDLTLVMLTAGIFGTVLYAMSKLRSRMPHGPALAAMGKIPTLILISSILWVLRCSYAIAILVKNYRQDWTTTNEQFIHQIVSPILGHWTGAAVLLLLAFVTRNSVWADASIQPSASTSAHPGQPQPVPVGMAQYPGPGGPMQYGQPQPQMYAYPQQGQQQPGYYPSATQPQQPYYEPGQQQVGYGYPAGAPVAGGQK